MEYHVKYKSVSLFSFQRNHVASSTVKEGNTVLTRQGYCATHCPATASPSRSAAMASPTVGCMITATRTDVSIYSGESRGVRGFNTPVPLLRVLFLLVSLNIHTDLPF